jgi:hypothetical protein
MQNESIHMQRLVVVLKRVKVCTKIRKAKMYHGVLNIQKTLPFLDRLKTTLALETPLLHF